MKKSKDMLDPKRLANEAAAAWIILSLATGIVVTVIIIVLSLGGSQELAFKVSLAIAIPISVVAHILMYMRNYEALGLAKVISQRFGRKKENSHQLKHDDDEPAKNRSENPSEPDQRHKLKHEAETNNLEVNQPDETRKYEIHRIGQALRAVNKIYIASTDPDSYLRFSPLLMDVKTVRGIGLPELIIDKAPELKSRSRLYPRIVAHTLKNELNFLYGLENKGEFRVRVINDSELLEIRDSIVDDGLILEISNPNNPDSKLFVVIDEMSPVIDRDKIESYFQKLVDGLFPVVEQIEKLTKEKLMSDEEYLERLFE